MFYETIELEQNQIKIYHELNLNKTNNFFISFKLSCWLQIMFTLVHMIFISKHISCILGNSPLPCHFLLYTKGMMIPTYFTRVNVRIQWNNMQALPSSSSSSSSFCPAHKGSTLPFLSPPIWPLATRGQQKGRNPLLELTVELVLQEQAVRAYYVPNLAYINKFNP